MEVARRGARLNRIGFNGPVGTRWITNSSVQLVVWDSLTTKQPLEHDYTKAGQKGRAVTRAGQANRGHRHPYAQGLPALTNVLPVGTSCADRGGENANAVRACFATPSHL